MSVFDKHLQSATFQKNILKLETLEDKIIFCKEFLALNGIVQQASPVNMYDAHPIIMPQNYVNPNTDILVVTRIELGMDDVVKAFIQREMAYELGVACMKHIEFTSHKDIINDSTQHKARIEVVKKK